MRRKNWILGIFLMALMLFSLMSFCTGFTQNKALVFSEERKEFTIVIDPGHGGFDGGAVAKDGTSEKDINLAVALELREILEEYPVRIVMTRESDESLDAGGESIKGKKQSDLKKRKEIIEEAKANLTISIHLNSYTSDESVYGAQVFYPKEEQKRTDESDYVKISEEYAQSVQKSLESNISDGRERKAMGKNDTYLFRNVKSPMILIECGFLSNHEECNKLKKAEYQGLLAKSIWEGINSILKLEKEQKIQIIQNTNKEVERT